MVKKVPKTLKKFEKNLLEYPPNEGTWMCIARSEDNTPCTMANSANSTNCWICGTIKPEKPKLIWPLYLVACKKVGIEPKERIFKFPAGTRGSIQVRIPNASSGWMIWGEDEELEVEVVKKPQRRTRRKA